MKPVTTSATRAVLYARVSSKDQEREGYSIPAQQKLLRRHAREHGLTITREFLDVETATQAGRAGFGAMVALLQTDRSCGVILVEKTDRLYRNFRDYVTVGDLGVTIRFVKENTIISPDSRSSDKLMHDIKVALAKNYADNLSEEVRKGLREKAEQGHWPGVAPVGYTNNRRTHLIELDRERAPAVARLFARFAQGDRSLKGLTAEAFADGLTHPRSSRRLVRSEIHRMLHNPIYYGCFRWKGKLHEGRHDPIISKVLFDAVQAVFTSANRSRYTKRRHAFAGLLSCGRCGCAITAEIKKGRYVYYHCTGYRGRCGNSYVREEDLALLLGEVVRRVQIPPEVADSMADALRDSQAEQAQVHRDAVSRLERRRNTIQAKLDRGYEDLLAGTISDQLWSRKSSAWEAELEAIRTELAKREQATGDYAATGASILELSQQAYTLYVTQERAEQRRLLNTLLSNCTFDRGSLSATYTKPFDLLVAGNETGEWRRGWDSNPRAGYPTRRFRGAPVTTTSVPLRAVESWAFPPYSSRVAGPPGGRPALTTQRSRS